MKNVWSVSILIPNCDIAFKSPIEIIVGNLLFAIVRIKNTIVAFLRIKTDNIAFCNIYARKYINMTMHIGDYPIVIIGIVNDHITL